MLNSHERADGDASNAPIKDGDKPVNKKGKAKDGGAPIVVDAEEAPADNRGFVPTNIADGEVFMATAWNGRIYNAVKNEGKNFVIVWDGQAMDFNLWAIPKGNPRKDLAMKFIAFSMRPEIMGQQSRYISYAPTVKAAIKHVAPAVLPDMPTAPENTRNAFAVDPLFWADHAEELTARFNTWLAK